MGAKDEEVLPGICRGNCTGGCFLNVTKRDGKVVKVEARDLPDPSYTRICSKGYFHPHRINSPHRVKYPMKRAGERGSGEFEAISWDQAIAEIGEAWRKVRSESGSTALGVCIGSGNYGCINGVGGTDPFTRFTSASGAASIALGYDLAFGLAMSRITGYGPVNTPNEPKEMLNANTILVWGGNPSVSQVHSLHFITEARDRGAKVIVIDPVFNTNAALANQYIPIKAATDGALAMGMIRYLIGKGWIDETFLKNRSTAPFLIKDDWAFLHLSDIAEVAEGEADPIVVCDEDGEIKPVDEAVNPQLTVAFAEVNGIHVTTGLDKIKAAVEEYTLARTSEITGIPESTIEQLCSDYYGGGRPASIYVAFGTNHYYNGHWSSYDMIALSVITGNMGRSGAGIGALEVTSTRPVNTAVAYVAPGAGPSVPTQMLGEVLDTKSFGGTPIDLRAMVCFCSDPMNNQGNVKAFEAALNRLENIVVVDMVMTDTAKFADYVLPAAHWFEKPELMFAWISHPFIMYQPQIVEPAFDSKMDFEIVKLLAAELGISDMYDFTVEDWARMVLDTDDCRGLGITYESITAKFAQRALPGESFVSWTGDPEMWGQMLTASGRAEINIDYPWAFYYAGQPQNWETEHTVHWEPAVETAENSDAAKRYPFHAMAERSRFRTHVQWWDVKAINEIDPEPTIKINPEDAAEMDVAQGDVIEVFNDRGAMKAKARIHAGLPRKTVLVPKGWQRHQILEGHWNNITGSFMNGMVNNLNFNDCQVNVRKA